MNIFVKTGLVVMAICVVVVGLIFLGGRVHFNVDESEAQAAEIATEVREVIDYYKSPPLEYPVGQNFRARGKCDPTDIDYQISYNFTNNTHAIFTITGSIFSRSFSLETDITPGLTEDQKEYFEDLEYELEQAFTRQGWTRD